MPGAKTSRVAGPDERAITRITVIGAVINLVLSILKICVGYLFGSYGLVADGVHSLSDLATDVAVVVGTSIGARPPDKGHPYGHGKYETFATVVVGLVLLVVAGGIVWESVEALLRGQTSNAGVVMLLVATLSIVSKELLYQATVRIARQTGSKALIANAWHHRSDALSSVAVLLGGVVGLLGWTQADQVAGALVGLMVGGVALKILAGSLNELAEAAIEPDLQAAIEAILDGTEAVIEWHHLRTRRIGRQILVDVHILVDPAMTVRASHDITEGLDTRILATLGVGGVVTVHVEPFDDTQRLKDPPGKRAV